MKIAIKLVILVVAVPWIIGSAFIFTSIADGKLVPPMGCKAPFLSWALTWPTYYVLPVSVIGYEQTMMFKLCEIGGK